MEDNMDRSWMPVTSGIINIVMGAFAIIAFLVFLVLAFVGTAALGTAARDIPAFMPMAVFLPLSIIYLIIGIVAIIGGAYGVKRQKWGWALTASIMSILIFWPCGVASIVFTIMGSKEFS
jgi:hypothetical protein